MPALLLRTPCTMKKLQPSMQKTFINQKDAGFINLFGISTRPSCLTAVYIGRYHRLYRACPTMLGRQGIIEEHEAEKIVEGLKGILQDIEDGKVEFSLDYEDIHMNVEQLLTERIGDTGKRLHTGRSRNDQVALDMRLYVKKEIKEIIKHDSWLYEGADCKEPSRISMRLCRDTPICSAHSRRPLHII